MFGKKDSITERYKAGKLQPRDELPEDLKIAIETFIQQVIIVEEYKLEYMNPEYYINLIDTFSKYPEHALFTWELLKPLLEEFE